MLELILPAIPSFALWLGEKIADKGFDRVANELTNDEVDKAFVKAIELTASQMQSEYPDILGNSIKDFFIDKIVYEELYKMLFFHQSISIEIIENQFEIEALPSNFILDFITKLKNNLMQLRTFDEILKNKEIFFLLQKSNTSLKTISDNTELTVEELREIKNILSQRARIKNSFDYKSFMSIYGKNILTTIGTVNFIGLGVDPSIKKGKRKDIKDIFVMPRLEFNSQHCTEDDPLMPHFLDLERQIEFYQPLFKKGNYVILGNPGAGKSMLIKYLMCDIIDKRLCDYRGLAYIPFRIELRKYHAYKMAKVGNNLLSYIPILLQDEYSMPSISEENIKDLLENKNTIMFFDGLDEIFNVADKEIVKQDIENFHNIYSNVKSITTSRVIGYNEVKLDETFKEVQIAPFSIEQIEEYTRKWYNLEEENDDIRETEINDFISKVKNIDKELISTPLFLSLIVILFRNNLKIPDSKLEIYQSCTNTLVDKWDANKRLKIDIDGRILQRKESLLSDLAFWQYQLESDKKSPQITYSNAKKEIENSLLLKKLADESNVSVQAEHFLGYIHNRSIYFDNNFTHKTFLEYYAAYWLYANYEKKHKIDARNNIIRERSSNAYWYVVLELFLNMIDKDQADTEILDALMLTLKQESDCIPFMLYVIPSIQNISESVQTKVYYKAITYLLDSCEKSRLQRDSVFRDVFSRIELNIKGKVQFKYFQNAIDRIQPKSNLYYQFLIDVSRRETYEDISKSAHIQKFHEDILKSEGLKKVQESCLYIYRTIMRQEYSEILDLRINQLLDETQNSIKYFKEDCLYIEASSLFKGLSYLSFADRYFLLLSYDKVYDKDKLISIFRKLENLQVNLDRLANYYINSIFANDWTPRFLIDNNFKNDESEHLISLANELSNSEKDKVTQIIFIILVVIILEKNFYPKMETSKNINPALKLIFSFLKEENIETRESKEGKNRIIGLFKEVLKIEGFNEFTYTK